MKAHAMWNRPFYVPVVTRPACVRSCSAQFCPYWNMRRKRKRLALFVHGLNLWLLYIFSNDKPFVRRMLSQIPSGGVSINDTVSHILNPRLPFGGIGASGLGAYHGKYTFDTFSHRRSILIRSNHIKTEAAFPPFSSKKLRLVKKLMK